MRNGNGSGLTGREVIILRLVAEGLTNKQIARRLSCGVSTVTDALQLSMARLRVPNRTAAVYAAIREDCSRSRTTTQK